MTQPNPQSKSKTRNSNLLLRSDSRDRCGHRTVSGRRCRIPAADSQSGLCSRHQTPATKVDVAATLTAGLDDFTDPVQINTFLSRLLLLLAQDKIAARRAAVLTYISSQLLHSVPTIQKHEDKQPVEIIFDIPRPQRPDYVEPPKPEPPEAHDRPTPEVHKEVRKDAPQSTPASTSPPASTPTAQPNRAVSSKPDQATTKPSSLPSIPASQPALQQPPRPTPATMPNPALPGSFGLPQADPLGGSRGSTRPSVRQPSWANHRT